MLRKFHIALSSLFLFTAIGCCLSSPTRSLPEGGEYINKYWKTLHVNPISYSLFTVNTPGGSQLKIWEINLELRNDSPDLIQGYLTVIGFFWDEVAQKGGVVSSTGMAMPRSIKKEIRREHQGLKFSLPPHSVQTVTCYLPQPLDKPEINRLDYHIENLGGNYLAIGFDTSDAIFPAKIYKDPKTD